MIQVAQFGWSAIVDYIKSLLLYAISCRLHLNIIQNILIGFLGHLLLNVKSLLDALRSASDLQRYLLEGFM